MKKIFNFAIIALTACAAAVGCSLMEQDVTFLQNDEIQFTTNIRAYNTKADEAVATGFVNGDEVGIIAFEPINVTNVKYTVTGNKLSSETPVHWAQGQTDSTIFAAYFPYDPKFSILDNSYAFSVKEDQSIPENYRLSDFLVASGSGRPGQSVKLDFYHYFSRVDISLAGELKGKVTGVSFSGVATSYGIAYGNAGEQNATIKAGRIASTEGTDAELWSLILVPQEVAPTLLVATSDGKTLSYDLGKKMDFQSGKRYQAVLSLGDDGTLDAEFVFRIFDWIWGNSVSFEQYVPRWFLCGPFTNHERAYELHKQENGLYVSDGIHIPEGAEFKFLAQTGSDLNLGVAGNAYDLLPGEWSNVAIDGYYFTVKEEGNYRVVLDVDNMKARLEPAAEWSVARDYYNENGEWAGEWIKMDYQDGLTWKLTGLYLPPMSRFCFLDANSYGNGETRVIAETPVQMPDGQNAYAAVSGTTYQTDNAGNGLYLYYAQGGFVDITLDLKAGTVLFQSSTDQSMTIAAVLRGIPDGTEVELTNATVYASSRRGVLISDDGAQGLFIYMGSNPDSVPAVGDVISVKGTKKKYDNQPELDNASITVTGRNTQLKDLVCKDISGYWDLSDYKTIAKPVIVSGKLGISLSGSENCYIVSENRTFKLYFPNDEYLKYGGSYVTVTGWYVGYNEEKDMNNLLLTDITGLKELDHGSGTREKPYDATGAALYAKSLGADVVSAEKVYIRGEVVSVQTPFSASSPQAIFRISGNGNEYDGAFTAYKVNYLENKGWIFGNSGVNRWDDVVLYGNVVLYNGGTPETASGEAYLYSVNGKTSEPAQSITLKGDGTIENPYNIPAAINFAQSLVNKENTVSDFVYVRGVISDVAVSYYMNYRASFTITESGKTDETFSIGISEANYLGNGQWSKDSADIAVGDSVVVCARLRATSGNYTWTFSDYNRSCPWLYRLNEVTKIFEPTIELDETNLRVICQAYQFEVGVTSNVDFEVSCDAEWLTVYNRSTFIWILTQDNPSTEDRTAHIKVWYESGPIYKEAILTIVQAGKDQEPPTEYEGDVLWQGVDFIHAWGDYNADLGYLHEYPDVFCEKYKSWSDVPAGSTMRIYYVCDSRYETHQIMVSTRKGGSDNYYAAGNLDPSKTSIDVPLSAAFLERLCSENGLLLAGCGYDLYAVTILPVE